MSKNVVICHGVVVIDKKLRIAFWISIAAIIILFVYNFTKVQNRSDYTVTIIPGGTTPTTDVTEFKNANNAPNTSMMAKTSVTDSKDSSTKTTAIQEMNTVPEDIYLDLNTATFDELILLQGIGEKRADAILRYRDENGGFNNIEEIMNVSGIGEKIFNNICDNIYVESPYYPEYDSNEEYYEESYENNEEIEEVPEESHITLEDVIPINLNEADVELLMYLPYVDEEIAGKIIDLREKIHGFQHVYELLYVEELTDSQVAEIIEYVYVEEIE